MRSKALTGKEEQVGMRHVVYRSIETLPPRLLPIVYSFGHGAFRVQRICAVHTSFVVFTVMCISRSGKPIHSDIRYESIMFPSTC